MKLSEQGIGKHVQRGNVLILWYSQEKIAISKLLTQIPMAVYINGIDRDRLKILLIEKLKTELN